MRAIVLSICLAFAGLAAAGTALADPPAATTAYGSQTPAGTSGGNADRPVSADITGLAPSTTYHFRLVATNASGTATGADAQFTTPPAGAAAVTIAATPRVVTFGKPVTIAGQVAACDERRRDGARSHESRPAAR